MSTDEQTPKYDIEQVRRENAVLRQYAAFQKASEDTISVQKIYVDIAGSLEAALVIDELIHFTIPRNGDKSGLRVRKNGFLWMAVSRTDWWERKRITANQADYAIEKLLGKNLIFKEIHLFNAQKTTHLRLNVPEFFKAYKELLDKENPPEDEDDTIAKDIADLYEMMGIGKSDTLEAGYREIRQGIGKSDTVSEKHDSLNTPNTPLTHPKESPDSILPAARLTEEEYKEAGDKVMTILAMSKPPENYWKGREFFRDNHLEYADWYHSKTNQVCNKRYQRSWQKAFMEWQDAQLEVKHLQLSYDEDVKWRKFITDPNELTKKAIAIKAAMEVKPVQRPVDLDDNGIPRSY